MTDKKMGGTEHNIRGLYYTGIAYTWFECDDCGEGNTTPSGFNERCVATGNDQ